MSQERKDELNELDLELEKMAQETPEMPADFHARWTEAVRAEAAGQQTEKKNETRRQWRYVLSAAAVFVFLIGGTLLTRGMKNEKAAKAPAMNESAAVVSEAADEPDAGKLETNGAVLFAEAVKDADVFAGGAAPEAQADFAMAAGAVYEDAMEAEAAYDAAPMYEAAEAYEEDAAYDMEAAYEAGAAYEASAYEEADSVQADSSAREKTAAAGETALSFGAKANKAAGDSAPAQTAAPTMTPDPAPTAEPTEAPTEAPAEEPEEEAAEASDGFTGFLKDLGIFTLKTAAVAAAGAALAFLAACIHRAWKKRKK